MRTFMPDVQWAAVPPLRTLMDPPKRIPTTKYYAIVICLTNSAQVLKVHARPAMTGQLGGLPCVNTRIKVFTWPWPIDSNLVTL
jgi:hypothetical protein